MKPNFKESLFHLKPSSRLFVSQLVIQIYAIFDRIILGFMTDNYQVVIYDNSQKIIKFILALVT